MGSALCAGSEFYLSPCPHFMSLLLLHRREAFLFCWGLWLPSMASGVHPWSWVFQSLRFCSPGVEVVSA